MILFNSQNDFVLKNKMKYKKWIQNIVLSENKQVGDINYIFCNNDDEYKINIQYLQHDTLTDVITFDYSEGSIISGDIFISTEIVAENAEDFKVSFMEEMVRVMSHGIFHLCGYNDKKEDEIPIMRKKESEAIVKAKELGLL